MKVKIKKINNNAVIPSYARNGDAGLDLTAISSKWNEDNSMVTFDTGLSIEIPEGYVGLIFSRSSISGTGLILTNCVGVIDSGYRGSVMLKFRHIKGTGTYDIGERVGQLIIIPYPNIEFEEVEELSETERGAGGYGSTGV